MATILLTGATGTVGSALASLLRLRGHRLICLIRPKDGKNPKVRLSQVLGQTAKDIIALNGDVIFPRAGLKEAEIQQWKGKINMIVHCAASTKFDEALAEMTTRVNVDGTGTMLNLAEELGVPDFHHMGTVYIAGNANSFGENNFDVGQTCRNIYEKTKMESERLVRNWRYGRYSVYRLSIVIGDSVTGYIPAFNGYYGFLSGLWHLKKNLASKPEAEMKKLRAEGINFDSAGILTLPIRLNFSPDSTLNLVPVDWVVKTIAELIEVSADNQIFHIVHSQPPNGRWTNDVSLKHLGIQGFHYGDGELIALSPRSLLGRIQRLVDRKTAQYLSYITHEPKFGIVNAPRVLKERYVLPPKIDEALLKKMLEYAKFVNFGRKKQITKAVEAA